MMNGWSEGWDARVLGGDTSARADFVAALEAALDAYADAVVVIRINLDRFARIGQSFGPNVAREVHAVLDERIRGTLGSQWPVLRYSEDSYAAITMVEAIDEDSLESFAMSLMDDISTPINTNSGLRIAVGSNVGVAAAGHFDPPDPQRIINAADVAVQRADVIGARRVVVYQVAQQDDPSRLPTLYQDMLACMEAGDFLPVYQPIVHLPDRSYYGVEALCRWFHTDHGVLAPADFIEEAERSGLIRGIDSRVRQAAMRASARWQSITPTVISINLSAIDLDAPWLLTHISSLLDETGLDPSSVIFEITETALAQQWNRSLRRIEALKSLGVRVAIDDFGAGHMHLDRLITDVFDVLKIDRSLVTAPDQTGRVEALMSGVTAMAHRLGLSVTAEGVETEDQLERVIAAGCDHAQGFLFDHPLREEVFTEMVTRAGG